MRRDYELARLRRLRRLGQNISQLGSINHIGIMDGETGLKNMRHEKLFDTTSSAVKQWCHDRNLVEGSTDQAQFVKLMEEAGELAKSIAKGRDIRDDLGDMLVVMINMAERNHLSLTECLEFAYEEIKDRKGKMVDGIFVKEADLKEGEA